MTQLTPTSLPPHSAPSIAVLFMHFGEDWLRGSEVCLLNLMAHLPKPFVPVLWCNQASLAQAAQERGINACYTSANMGLNWRNLQQAKQVFAQHQIMLIHANSAAPVKLASVIARQAKLPLLCHLHSRYPWYQRWGFGLPLCSAVVGVSQAVLGQLQYDGFRDTQLSCIPNGIDCAALLDAAPDSPCLKQQLGLPEQAFLMVSVGSLIPRKGMDNLLHACARLHLQGIPAHLAIIGSGPEQDNLTQLTHQLNLKSHVHFLGEQAKVVALINQGADVFVSGAREEVFGLVLAEAGLAKLAVIAPDVGGIAEVIEHQVNGLLYPDGDQQALNLALRRCYFSPKLRWHLGQQGHKKAHTQFAIEQHCHRMSQLYFKLLNDQTERQSWLDHWPSRVQLEQACQHANKIMQRRLVGLLGRSA